LSIKPNEPHVLVVEDEPLLRQQLLDTLRELWPGLNDIDEADCGVAAVRCINQSLPDIAFLDIHLPDMSGLEIARLLRGRCQVVFVTAYDEHAVAAFEQEAIDYVLKPATAARLGATVARLKGRQAGSASADMDHLFEKLARQLSPTGSRYLRWVQASAGNVLQLIPVEDVLYFNADEKYTLVFTGDGEALIRKPIRELVDELDPEQFWQIHRSTVVRLSAIARVIRAPTGHVTVHLRGCDRALPVSRAFAHRFRQM
jgi:DNA-binding LytR/AlgR family response regulator